MVKTLSSSDGERQKLPCIGVSEPVEGVRRPSRTSGWRRKADNEVRVAGFLSSMPLTSSTQEGSAPSGYLGSVSITHRTVSRQLEELKGRCPQSILNVVTPSDQTSVEWVM